MITAKLLLAYLLQATNVTGIPVDTSQIDPKEAYCLAENIYYEARNEDIKGQYAVASVTLNRMRDPRYPSTICGVVQQSSRSKFTEKIVCAFSWFCENDRHGKDIPLSNKDGSVNQSIVDQFQIASIVAITVLGGDVEDNTDGATHFHNPFTSNPDWAHTLKKTMRVGNHDFYKLGPPKNEQK